MLLYILSVSFIVFSAGIGYISYRYKIKAVTDAKELVKAYAHEYANLVKSNLEEDFGISRGMTMSLKACEDLDEGNSEEIQFQILRNVLIENPSYIASFLQWELSDVDPTYHKEHGRRRYFAYREDPFSDTQNYSDKKPNIITMKGIVDTADYDPDNAYYVMQRNHREFIHDPYFYTYGDITEMPSDQANQHDAVLETTIAIPIITDGRFRALAGVDIPLNHFRDLVIEMKPIKESKAFIISNNGRFIAHADHKNLGVPINDVLQSESVPIDIVEKIQNGNEVEFIVKDNQLGELYYVLSPIHIAETKTPWSFGIYIPIKVVLADAKKHFYLAVMVGIIGLGILALVIWFIARHITKPIQSTTKLLNDLAQGRIGHRRRLLIDRADEIGEMAESLNILIEGLHHTVNYAEEIGKGNLDIHYNVLSKDDLLGKALIDMKNKLKDSKTAVEISNRELEKLSMVAQRTDNAVMIMDKEGVVEWVNSAFIKMYGYDLNDLSQEFNNKIMEVSSHPEIEKVINQCRDQHQTVTYDSMIKSKDGENIYAQTTLTPVVNDQGQIIKLIAIDSDITSIKRANEEIKKQRNELEILNATKDRFFSILAHDLQNPFSSLYSMSELIIQNFDEASNEERLEMLKKIYNSAKHIYELLQDLLTWSRSQRGLIEHNPVEFNLTKLIDENINVHRLQAEKKEISINSALSDDLTVYADREMVNTVLRNLVTNAVKFTNIKGNITVKASEFQGDSQSAKEFIAISVEDDGIGISQEDQNKLFRIDIKTKAIGKSREKGTGLGLILCKEFTEKNGGQIWIESEVNKGSKFQFTVPLNPN